MSQTIHYILNNREITSDEHPATTVLDTVRRSEHLIGTKEGCREGDCGACTVLVGELHDDSVTYKAVNSCLLPLGELHGKHVVTIEGINVSESGLSEELTPIQQAMVDEGGTQCGFCTPGFIVSMTGYTLSIFNLSQLTTEGMTTAIDGNLCRCTGYASIRRAIDRFIRETERSIGVNDANGTSGAHLQSLVRAKIVPSYFLTIPQRLKKLHVLINAEYTNNTNEPNYGYTIGGGTDLFVQKPDALLKSSVRLLNRVTEPAEIREEDGWCVIDATTPIAHVQESTLLRKHLPQMHGFLELFASTPIRNRATLGGNITNASPIGDMTVILLALNAEIILRSPSDEHRHVLLRNFYKAYKTLDKHADEIVETLRFRLPSQLPDEHTFFTYEKVSRRTYLDIASVNSALQLRVKDGVIQDAHASAGGVAPVPLYLARTAEYLVGKTILPETAQEAAKVACSEITPISDARGSVEYKRLLLRQLMYAHFMTLFPELLDVEAIV